MFKKWSASMFALFLGITLLSGCGKSSTQENFEQQFTIAQGALNHLDSNYKKIEEHVKDPTKMGLYERTMFVALEKLEKEYPDSNEVKSMISQFKNDTTENGVIFKEIKNDYNKVISEKDKYNTLKSKKAAELKHTDFSSSYFNTVFSTNLATSLELFDEHFIDYINIIASISSTVDPVVVDKTEFKNNKDSPLGSQLVGNPAYGNWVKDPVTGHQSWSFLEIYGFMSLMDNMIDGGRYRSGYNYNRGSDRYRYDNWSKNRNWSYNQDVYANKYATPYTKSKYQSSLSGVKANPVYKNQTFDNKNLKAQNTKIAGSSNSKYSSNLVRNTSSNKSSSSSSASSNKSSSTYKGNTGSNASKYSSSIRSSSSSSRSSKGGK